MIKKKVVFVALLVFYTISHSTLYAQGWLYIAEAPSYATWRPNDVIETQNHEYLISFWDYDKTSTIIKLSPEGDLQSSTTLNSPDTTTIISKLFFNEVSTLYTAVGLCIPTSGETEAVVTIQFDEDLNIIQRNVVSCISLSRPLLNITMLKHGESFKIAFTETNHKHHLAKFSLDGEIQQWQRLEIDSLNSICNLFEINGSNNNFGVFASISNNSLAQMGVLVFNDSLQLVKRTIFPQWEYNDNNGLWTNYLNDLINSMIVPNPNLSGYFISARLQENLYSQSSLHHERSTIVAKTDTNFVIQEDYHIIEHFNDSTENPAYYKSIDCFSNGPIYHCCMLTPATNENWPYIPSTVIVTKIDKDFNIVWKKRLLTDLGYSPFAITATSDGGCVVVGWVYDFNSEHRLDLFALKITADGTLGINEIKVEDMVFIYPNPTNSILRINGIEAKETEVYNTLGQCVLLFYGNECNLEHLSEGTYLLKIKDSKNNLHHKKVIVNH